MSTGKLVAPFRRNYQDVTDICFTADGSRFVSAGVEGLGSLGARHWPLRQPFNGAAACT